MTFISTYNLNLNQIGEVVDFDCIKSDSWEELICEDEDGYFSREGEYISFNYMDEELTIFYNISVSGTIDYDPGDYYTPPYSDVDITDVSIDVTEVTFAGYEIELTKEMKILFSDIIKKNI